MIPLSQQLRHMADNCAACAGTGRITHHDGAVSECDCLHLTCTDLRLLAGQVEKLEQSQCANGESVALETTCGRSAR